MNWFLEFVARRSPISMDLDGGEPSDHNDHTSFEQDDEEPSNGYNQTSLEQDDEEPSNGHEGEEPTDHHDHTLVEEDDEEPSNSCYQTSFEEDDGYDQTSFEQDDGEPGNRYDRTYFERDDGWHEAAFEQDGGEPSNRYDRTYVEQDDGWDRRSFGRDDGESSNRYDHASFTGTYRCYAIPSDSEHIESGNRILMPTSALNCLESLDITYPMMFEIKNPSTDRSSHCGVLQFTSDEGTVLLPQWMMKNLSLEEADIVVMKNVTLPMATFMKFQPHTMNFLNVPEPKELLERALKNYSCVTTGDTIMIADNDKSHYIDIVETKPSDAVSIIQTDCPVDFAPPLDYKEPEAPAAQRLPRNMPVLDNSNFNRFMGMGIAKRLDGKPSKLSVSSEIGDTKHICCAGEGMASNSTSTSQPPNHPLFGSNMVNAHQGSTKKLKLTEEVPKFQPFTGKKYILNPGSMLED